MLRTGNLVFRLLQQAIYSPDIKAAASLHTAHAWSNLSWCGASDYRPVLDRQRGIELGWKGEKQGRVILLFVHLLRLRGYVRERENVCVCELHSDQARRVIHGKEEYGDSRKSGK